MQILDFLETQYEVHLTAPLETAPALPEGFSETSILNKDGFGNTVQTYVLHNCRFAKQSEIPWSLESQYERFKVEQKILLAYPKEGLVYLNEVYFSDPAVSKGIEIHIRTEERYTDMLSSRVDGIKHQTVFLPNTKHITKEQAFKFVEKYSRNASKLYIEAVIYDNNPDMDKDWEAACH